MAINDRPPVDNQPRVGESVLMCAHAEIGTETHQQPAKVFRIRPAVPFVRPNGTKGTATLGLICFGCWNGCGGNLSKIKWCKDGTWQSRRPVVRQSPDNVPREGV